MGHIQERVDVDVVFISLGANDIHLPSAQFPGQAVIEHQVAKLLGSISPHTTIYWILPHRNIEKLWDTNSQYEIVVNAILSAQDSGNWPNLKTLSLDSWSESQHKAMRSILHADGIHLSEAGVDAWALMILGAIAAEFPPTPDVQPDPDPVPEPV